jgi:hypothetical protein
MVIEYEWSFTHGHRSYRSNVLADVALSGTRCQVVLLCEKAPQVALVIPVLYNIVISNALELPSLTV